MTSENKNNILDIIILLFALCTTIFIGLAIISGILMFTYWYIFLIFAMFFAIINIFTILIYNLIY